MTAGALIFGALALFVTSLNGWAWSRDRRLVDALGLSFMLLAIWFVSNVSVAIWGVPEGMRLFALWDLCAGLTTLASLRHRPTWWKGALLAGFGLMMCAHVAVWAHYLDATENASSYLKVLDWLTLTQLAAMAWPGSRHVAIAFHDSLRSSAVAGHRLGD